MFSIIPRGSFGSDGRFYSKWSCSIFLGETRDAASSESAAISPLRPLLLRLIYQRLMLLHLRQLLEQFLLHFFVYFVQTPTKSMCRDLFFHFYLRPPTVPGWLVCNAAPCFLVLVEPQKLVPYISVHDVTDQHDACAAPWCCYRVPCQCSLSLFQLLVEHCLVEIKEDAQRRWLNNFFMSIWFYCFLPLWCPGFI